MAREAAAQGLRWRTPGQRNRRRAGASGRTWEGCSLHLCLQLKCRWLDHGRIIWVGGVRAPRAVEPSPEPRRPVGFPEGGVLRKDRALFGPGAALFARVHPTAPLPCVLRFPRLSPPLRPAASSLSPYRPLPRPLAFTADTRDIFRSALGAWRPARCRCSDTLARSRGGDDQCRQRSCDRRSGGRGRGARVPWVTKPGQGLLAGQRP